MSDPAVVREGELLHVGDLDRVERTLGGDGWRHYRWIEDGPGGPGRWRLVREYSSEDKALAAALAAAGPP